jgi:bile acid-coenzyme A ligase
MTSRPAKPARSISCPMTAPAPPIIISRAEPKRRADGWESLGDIGRLDADGYLYLGDRLADMILRGGANIYPAEVEAAVSAHPDVRSCVVVGLPDPELGQRVHAIVELADKKDAQAVADSMGDFLSDRLSRYKHPESFEAVAVGLRDDSGKVRRTLLRDERAAWVKDNRKFRIFPARPRAKAG